MDKQGQSGGFTLIEVMVALFVFAVGVTALIVSQTDSLNTTAALEDRVFAELVAENVLTETVVSTKEFNIGYTYGEEQQGGRRYSWARQIRPTGVETIQWIEISVRLTTPNPANQQTAPVLYSLSGFRKDI